MRIMQFVVLRLTCLVCLAVGVAVTLFSLTDLYDLGVRYLPDSTPLRVALGVIAILACVVGLFPWPRRSRSQRAITYAGPHGRVTVQLDFVEKALRRAAGKLRSVKRINVHVIPADDALKVHIKADIVLRVAAGTTVQQTHRRVTEFIDQTSKRILGRDVVVSVDLNVCGIVIDDLPDVESFVVPASANEESETEPEDGSDWGESQAEEPAPDEEPAEEEADEEEDENEDEDNGRYGRYVTTEPLRAVEPGGIELDADDPDISADSDKEDEEGEAPGEPVEDESDEPGRGPDRW